MAEQKTNMRGKIIRRERFEERAAIKQYEADMDREQAELSARLEEACGGAEATNDEWENYLAGDYGFGADFGHEPD